MILLDLYKKNKISINLFRYILAILVIFDHSYHMAGFGEEPLIFSFGQRTAVGFFAVSAFFAISGFLITNASLNSEPFEFFTNRFLRIWPALIFLLIFSAFVLGPILVQLNGQSLRNYLLNFDSTGPWTYLFHNIFLPVDFQNNLSNLFDNSPNGPNFNGSLWTLPLEIRAYLICFFLILIGRKLGLLRVFITFQLYITICIIGDSLNNRFIYYVYPDFIHLSSKFLFAFFFAGIIAIVFRERQIDSRYFYGAIVAFIFSAITGGLIFQTFGISLLIFIIPFISEKLNLNRFKIFKNDISYGTYIWGYLVGQVLYSFFKFETHIVFLVATVIITTVIAMFSWFVIEKPALNWKKR